MKVSSFNFVSLPSQCVIDKFWSLVDISTVDDECWLWTGSRDHFGIIARAGYGKFIINYVGYYAHRLSWLIHYGPIPTKQLIIHKCINSHCINPKHLFLGNQDASMKHKAK